MKEIVICDAPAPVKPVLRWAGGKSHVVNELATCLPMNWNRYIDPMVGGGAFFFFYRPDRSILADINADLINFYKELREHPKKLIPLLLRQKASREQYYRIRAQERLNPLEKALRLGYLNRLCWNGLYRVNMQGHYNVPMGSRLPINLWDESRLRQASKALQNTELRVGDFEQIFECIQKCDFVFLDPPYPRGANGNNGFNRYSSVKFFPKDHSRLATQILKLDKRGAFILLILSDDSKIFSLYPRIFRKRFLIRKSLISGKALGRKDVKEYILTNY